jgi:hypothetical protein
MPERHPKQEENSSREPTAAAIFPQLAPGERPAPIVILSAAKRAALIAFLHGDGVLHKSRGVWTASPARTCGARIYGMTIADLARDGMLTVTVIGKGASARLTPHGTWFARSLAAEMNAHDEGRWEWLRFWRSRAELSAPVGTIKSEERLGRPSLDDMWREPLGHY